MAFTKQKLKNIGLKGAPVSCKHRRGLGLVEEGVQRRSTRRPERSSARMHAGLRLCWDLESAADSLYVVARDNRVQKERSAVLQTEEATKG